MKKEEKISFLRGISLMSRSGLGLYEALKILETNPLSKQIRKSLEKGLDLRACFSGTGRFNSYELDMIHTGDLSNELPKAIDGILDLHNLKKDLKQKYLNALSYPALVLTMAMGTIIFMFHFIIPSFEEVFSRSQRGLPWITQLLFDAHATFKIFFVSPLFWLGFSYIGLLFWINRKVLFHRLLDLGIRIPWVRTRFFQFVKYSMFSITALQLKAGIPFLDALEMGRKFVFVPSLQLRMDNAIQEIKQGNTVHNALAYLGFFSSSELALVRSAEETNELETVFRSFSNESGNKIRAESEILGKFLEPIILIIVGGIVGLILLALYIPMFQINQVF